MSGISGIKKRHSLFNLLQST